MGARRRVLRKSGFDCLINVTTMDAAKAATEAELLAQCRCGDAAAWDELFDRHYAAAGRFIFQLGYSFTPEDMEEICQETFLSVIRNLRRFEGRSHFQTWVFRIAANKARDYRQRQIAAKRGGGIEAIPLHPTNAPGAVAPNPPCPNPGPDADLVNSENSALLIQALEQLEAPARELIELRYFAGFTYEQIGQSLKINPKTVGSRLSRCLDQLEELLKSSFAAT